MSGTDPHWSEVPAEEALPEPTAASLSMPDADLMPRPALGAIAQQLADVSPAWAAVVIDPDHAPTSSVATSLGRDRERGVESIREGWLLHRAASRLAPAASPDLALLVGDWCYAAGLCTIADHGTLDDVAALARLVADLSARCDEPIDALQGHWSETIAAMSS